MRLWLSFIAALILIPVALAFTVLSDRATAVRCARTNGHVNCSETESIGPYVLWSQSVENITLARDTSQSSDGSNSGVVVETANGDDVELTSTFLDDKQQADIADRVHQFANDPSTGNLLAFRLAPSLLNLALGGGFSLVCAIWALYAFVQILRRIFGVLR